MLYYTVLRYRDRNRLCCRVPYCLVADFLYPAAKIKNKPTCTLNYSRLYIDVALKAVVEHGMLREVYYSLKPNIWVLRQCSAQEFVLY